FQHKVLEVLGRDAGHLEHGVAVQDVRLSKHDALAIIERGHADVHEGRDLQRLGDFGRPRFRMSVLVDGREVSVQMMVQVVRVGVRGLTGLEVPPCRPYLSLETGLLEPPELRPLADHLADLPEKVLDGVLAQEPALAVPAARVFVEVQAGVQIPGHVAAKMAALAAALLGLAGEDERAPGSGHAVHVVLVVSHDVAQCFAHPHVLQGL
ncbi:unnamed protein product, partial [Ixodes pacificus]